MSKLMSSLIAAAIAGAFNVSAVAADTAPAAERAVVEKPAAAPRTKVKKAKKHAANAAEKKADAAAGAAAPAKK